MQDTKCLSNTLLNAYHVTATAVECLQKPCPGLQHWSCCSARRMRKQKPDIDHWLGQAHRGCRQHKDSNPSDSKALYFFPPLRCLRSSPRQQLTFNSNSGKEKERKRIAFQQQQQRGHVVRHIMVEKLVHLVNTTDRNPSIYITVLPH